MSASLRGKTIAFSGSFSDKNVAVARAIRAGATVTPNVSKKVDFLIKANPKAIGMREVVAKYNGTKIVSANSFLSFVGAGGARKVAAAKAAAAPMPKAAGRVRTIAPSRQMKKTAASAPVNNTAKKVASLEIPVATIYADKTPEEIEKMEQEAAKFGPMPWLKDSKFSQKQQKLEQQRKARRSLKAKQTAAAEKKKAAKAAASVPKPEAAQAAPETEAAQAAPETEKPAAAALVVQAAPAVSAETPAITFAPSKGLTIKFNGDFGDFCRAANQLVVKKESSSATTVVEKLEAPTAEVVPEVVAAPVSEKVAASEPTATETNKEATAVAAEVKVAAKKKAAAPAAGRSRKVVISSARKLADGQVELKKKTVSFTGTFFELKRAGLQALAKGAGAKVTNGFEGVDFVVVGRDAADKKRLAKKAGIATLSEKDFIASASH